AQKPSLTTIHYPVHETGYRALELLLRVMAGEASQSEVVRIPTRLVTRESCGCPPGGFAPPEVELNDPRAEPASVYPLSASEPLPPTDYKLFKAQLTQTMKEAALIESRQLGPVEVGNLCRNLLEGFELSLKEGELVHFRSALAELLQRIVAVNDDPYA